MDKAEKYRILGATKRRELEQAQDERLAWLEEQVEELRRSIDGLKIFNLRLERLEQVVEPSQLVR